jgi:medium-chain acyl-[acyl-carrier-protein] hydrolase
VTRAIAPAAARPGKHSATGPEWSFAPEPRPAATMTLMCFHAAGSGAAMYRQWPQQLPGGVEAALVRMPGRESRLTEDPIEDFGTAVTALAAGLEGRLDRDYAFFGHSMGAYLAFAIAASRVAAGLRPPSHLFVSAARPPHLFRPPLAHRRKADEDLVRLLGDLGGTSEALLDNDEMRPIILRPFRADLAICDTITLPNCPLPCAISVFGGEDDGISPGDLGEWSRWSTGPVSTTIFRGGHFFVNGESQADVLREVTRVLEGYLAACPPPAASEGR